MARTARRSPVYLAVLGCPRSLLLRSCWMTTARVPNRRAMNENEVMRQGGSGESNGSGAAPGSPHLAPARASENTGHDEKMKPQQLGHPHVASQAPGEGRFGM